MSAPAEVEIDIDFEVELEPANDVTPRSDAPPPPPQRAVTPDVERVLTRSIPVPAFVASPVPVALPSPREIQAIADRMRRERLRGIGLFVVGGVLAATLIYGLAQLLL